MKTKQLHKDKVQVITLGCAKNLVDSEVMITQLRGNKIDVSHESLVAKAPLPEEKPNIIIINTCGFIENAKQESIDTIVRYAEEKSQGSIDKLFVTGCLSQRYRDDLQHEIPEVDAFFGTMELPLLLKKFNADFKHELVGERITTTDQHYAYLKISEGCDRPCSFCAIPLMRGKHRSKPMEELEKEARFLANQGCKELLLIAQDSTYYGLDIYKKRNLAELMEKLANVEGIDWLRLHYAYPSGFPMDVLDIMAQHPNICRYLDIPLQHGSTSVLKHMRRGITREKTEELLASIREKVPGIAIRTTLIAGHPGEGEKEFLEMVDFVEKSRFDRLGIFTYSHEENTHAYQMEDALPEEEKMRRANHVMEVQEQISFEINQEKVGKTYKVLIDRIESGNYIGRTEFDSPEVDNEVIISAKDQYLRLGDFAEITIEKATEFDLYGKLSNHAN